MRHYCTYFDERYLDKAVALARSLQRHAGEHILHAVTMTAAARTAMQALGLDSVRIVPMERIEEGDADLRRVKQSRSLLSYYWTTTPAVMLHFLKHERCSSIVYVDADICFFSDPEVLFAESPSADLWIHEHRHDRPIRWYRARGGRFNVGLVGARNTERAIRVLERWRAQCLEKCSALAGRDGLGDQMYLDGWPSADADVCILQNPGAGMAPWNVLGAEIQGQVSGVKVSGEKGEGSRLTVSGVPLVFYHFHAMIRRPGGRWTLARRYYVPRRVRDAIYAPYIRALGQACEELAGAVPEFRPTVTPFTWADRFWKAVFATRVTAEFAWLAGRLARGRDGR